MLTATGISGNIEDDRYNSVKNYERLHLSRQELEKNRMRRNTDRGTDVGIILEPGTRLHHGDVLSLDKMIVVKQIPEKVVSVHLEAGIQMPVLVGHIIGNRHRPIAIHDNVVRFPIQGDSELEIFERLLSAIDGIKLSVDEIVFIPHSSTDVHGHA